MKIYNLLLLTLLFCCTVFNTQAQTVVNSLSQLRAAIILSNQNIVMTAGDYNLEDLANNDRIISFSGSNNVINLNGVRIEVPVGSIRDSYILVQGSNNIITGGEIEDTYRNGLTEITDFVAYHQDANNLAYGLRGAAVMTVSGEDNLINGIKLTVRGSHLYGYGSMYGINQYNTFGMNKRCGLLINGARNTLDNVEVQMRAFGHGIFMQGNADKTVIKNTLVEGRVRAYADLYNETDPNSFPFRSDYKLPETSGTDFDMPFSSSVLPIPTEGYFSLSEDGIRAYTGSGSVTVENCIVRRMRGGIRLYLGTAGTVTNSLAIDCGETNYNMPKNGVITSSSGNFAYAPLNDFRLSKSDQKIELTIIPSPNASGPHNIADVLGNTHNITFHRTPGPLDSNETRAIVVSGNNSTIINETEYSIILQAGTSGNKVTSCGPVTDNGTNTVITNNCTFDLGAPICAKTAALIQAECFDQISGAKNEGTKIGSVKNGYWAKYTNLDLTNMNSVAVTAASKGVGGTIEFRLDGINGTLIGSVDVAVTNEWTNWKVFSANIARVTGTHNLYTVFTGKNGWLFNIDFFGFSENVICNKTVNHIEAECFTNMSGIKTQPCEKGTLNIGWINTNDWVKYEAIDLNDMNSFKANVSGKTTGSKIEVRLDAVNGTLIGELEVSNTNGDQNWVSNSVSITQTAGTHDVYLVFKGGTGYLFNLDYFGFTAEQTLSVSSFISEPTLKLYPNPSSGIVYFLEKTNYTVVNSLGQTLLSGEADRVDLSAYSSGVYLVLVNGEAIRIIKK